MVELIFALTTSVFIRSHALHTGIPLPPAALVDVFPYFLPGTASRVDAYVEELEDHYVPHLGEIRRTSIARSGMASWERAKEGTAAGRESVDKGVKNAMESIEQGTGVKWITHKK
ncbi:uncharacterized protein EDB91DRAFT_798589 [Suillus paluster]|uniref:uncharacterized protein n=1 Tax=Suillus paluster TaxID=48578 RepID=UPI001B85F132|nr:uncharacterized protein EDB91DRAFT_798589 [Suillus paluster]KAG1729958.1 hypothetical protein EDB91DRAFT_798589 [Suillus paluster]